MKTFKELKKQSKIDKSALPAVKVTLMGDCATHLLAEALRGYGVEIGLDLQVFDVDYNQLDAQTMDENSELYNIYNPACSARDGFE